MNFNYSYEKKKFEQEWAKLEKEYGQAGMSDKDIQEMKNFDYDCFKLNRNTVLHTYDLQFCNDFDDNGNDDFGNIDLSKVEYITVKEQEKVETHSRFWWIEELDSNELIQKVKTLSYQELDLLDLHIFSDLTLKEISKLRGIPYRTIKRKFEKIKKLLK